MVKKSNQPDLWGKIGGDIATDTVDVMGDGKGRKGKSQNKTDLWGLKNKKKERKSAIW